MIRQGYNVYKDIRELNSDYFLAFAGWGKNPKVFLPALVHKGRKLLGYRRGMVSVNCYPDNVTLEVITSSVEEAAEWVEKLARAFYVTRS